MRNPTAMLCVLTPKLACVAFSPVMQIAGIPFWARLATLTVPRRFKGVHMICMLSRTANNGIQNVSVLPDPVAEIKKTSFSFFSKASAILICQRHGVCLKNWIVFWRRLTSGGGVPGEFCDIIGIFSVIAFPKTTASGLSTNVGFFVYQCFPQAASEGLGGLRLLSLNFGHILRICRFASVGCIPHAPNCAVW